MTLPLTIQEVLFRVVSVPDPETMGLDGLAARAHGKVMLNDGLPAGTTEQYRNLAATLHHARQRDNVRTVMVASAMPGEGKTLTATNLALTLSESYRRRVIIIDADLRRPMMHEMFKLPNGCGVNDALMRDRSAPPAFEVSPRLAVIPAGRPNPDPLGGLTSPRLKALVDAAAHAYDWVIIDTPPVGLLTDANLVVQLVDAAVMVIAASTTSYKVLQRAADALGRDRIIGVVLNRAARPAFTSYGYDGYYGGYGPGD
jgi:capsular exopolysaccharide synthesis family protein